MLGKGVQPVGNSVLPSPEQVKAPDSVGFFVVQGGSSYLDGEREMDLDAFPVEVTGTGAGEGFVPGLLQGLDKEGLNLIAPGEGSENLEVAGGVGKKPGSYRRRPRRPSDVGNAKLVDREKKRSREAEILGVDKVLKKKKGAGAAGEVVEVQGGNEMAGLLGQSCPAK